jgi:hypothetical protein
MNAEERRGSAQRKVTYEEEVRAAARAAVKRTEAERRVTDVRTRLIKQAGAAAQREMLAGVMQEQTFASRREQIYKRLTSAYIEGERQKTAAHARENERRVQTEQQTSSRMRSIGNWLDRAGRNAAQVARRAAPGAISAGREVGGNFLQAASSAFGEVSGQMQGARMSRAQQDETLRSIFTKTRSIGGQSVSLSEVRGRIERVFAFADENKLDVNPIIEALSGAQEHHSALSGMTSASRGANLEDALSTALFAHQNYENVGQSVEFSALLAEQGIRGQRNRGIVESFVAMSRNGSVEMGDALRSGLQPMIAYAQARTGAMPADATTEQRSQAYQDAMVEFFAGEQVAAAAGGTVRWSGNRYNSINRALGNNHAQNLMGEKLFNTFGRGSQERAVLNQMFRRTDNGYRLQGEYQNAFRFSEGMGQLFGSNTQRFTNVLGSYGGGVTSQAMQKPDLQLISMLMGRDTSGQTYGQRARELVSGAHLDQADIALTQASRAESDATALQDQTNRNIKALLDNTEALRASSSVTKFRSENPMTSAFIRALPGGEATEQAAVPYIDQIRGAAHAVESRAGTGSLIGEGYQRQAIRAVAGVIPEANPAAAFSLLTNSVRDAVMLGLQKANIVATIDPVAARQVATERVSENNRRQPP